MIKLVKQMYELSKTDKEFVADALQFSVYSMPVFKENTKILHFLKNTSTCSALFVHKNIFNDVKPVITAFEKSLRNKGKDNSNSEYRASMGIISEYLFNKYLGCLSINTPSHSYSDSVKYPCDTSHFMGRIEVKSSHLSSPYSHQKQGYGSIKGNRYILHATTDECLISVEALKDIRGIEKYYSNYEDYYLVIFHGIMTTNSFNYHLNKGHCSPAHNGNDKKVELCDDIYNELISVNEYIFKYLYRMTSPLHLLNCVSNSNYVRMLNTVLAYFFKSLHTPYSVLCIEPLLDIKGKLLTSIDKLYDYSYDRYRRNATHFKFYNSITLRFACPYRSLKHSPNITDKIRFIDMEISVDDKNDKSGKKLGKVNIKSRFTKDMPNFNNCDEDTIENFIRDNFTKYPVIGYGLRGIFGLALKNYNRNCISGANVQHTAYYIDIDDMLNVFSISDNDLLNDSYHESNLTTPFFYDWRCLGMVEMIPDAIFKNCLKMDKKSVIEDLKVLTDNIERIKDNYSPNISNSSLNDIEFLQLVPLFYVLYLLTHIFSSRALPNNLKNRLNYYYPTCLLSPKGLYNYNNEINNYVKTGFLEDLRDVLYDGVDVIEYNYVQKEKESENIGFEGISFGVGETTLSENDMSMDDISEMVDKSFGEVADKVLGDASQDFINHMENEMCEFSSIVNQHALPLNQPGPVDSYPIVSENVFTMPAEDINISIDDLDLLGDISKNDKPNVNIDIEEPIEESIEIEVELNTVSIVENESKSFDLNNFTKSGFGEDVENPLGAGQPNNTVSFGDIDSLLNEKSSVSHSVLYDFFDKEFNFSDSQVRAYLTRNYVSIEDFREMLSKKILDIKDMTSLIDIFRIIMK